MTQGDRGHIPDALRHAVQLLRSARFQDAENVLRQVLDVEPDHADALHLLGVSALQTGRAGDAERMIARAVELAPGNPTFHLNLGTARHYQGKLPEALAALDTCIQLAPTMADGFFNRGNTLREMGERDAARAAYRRAVELNPQHVVALNNLGSLLHDRDDTREAAVLLERAVALAPDYPDAHFNLGSVLWSAERRAEAVESYRRAVTLDPQHLDGWANMAIVLLELEDTPQAIEALDRALAIDPCCVKTLAARAAALNAAGDRETLERLVDLDGLVLPHEVEAPPAYAGVEAFNAALSAHVLAHPSLVADPLKHATRNGLHSGNLLGGDKGPMADLESVIDAAVRGYIERLSGYGPHLFTDNLPERWQLNAWAVVMNVQGHQVAHMHPDAWISGVYYPKLPAEISSSDTSHAGWIEFGRPDTNYYCPSEPPVRLIEPREGLMLLFPSYFWHRTIPFQSEEQRISIAFDVIRA